MRKKMVLILVVLWIIAMIKIFWRSEEGAGIDIVSAFSNDNYVETNSKIYAEVDLGNKYFTDDERKSYVRDVADDIGLLEYDDVSVARSGSSVTGELVKVAKNAKTSIKLVTIEQVVSDNLMILDTYMYVSIDINNSIESATFYYEKVKDVFESMGVVADISLSLSGSIPGKLNEDEEYKIAEKILEEMDAFVVCSGEQKDAVLLYGYSEKIEDYISFCDSKTNINVVITYDEKNNQTNITMATPLMMEDF